MKASAIVRPSSLFVHRMAAIITIIGVTVSENSAIYKY